MFVDSTAKSAFGAMFAMSTVSVIPILLLFIFFQKQLIEGIATSGLKGWDYAAVGNIVIDIWRIWK